MSKSPKQSNSEIGYVKPREITEEMKDSYIDYAMSVIISRALPDVRDGLKPVHRRILYVMLEEGLKHDAKFRKSATVVGSCLGRYHPHGDIAVYDSLVRMAQDFSLRYPLVQGQGNFGCFAKDTKVRLTDGRALTFRKLIKEQKERKRHWTFSFNPESRKVEVAEIRKPRLTRKKERIIEITLDNGEKIKCTLAHRFMLRNGSYKEAQDLKPGNSLMPLYTEIYNGKEDKNLKGYERILQPMQNVWEFTHHLADRWNLRNRAYKKGAGRIRHHRDFYKLNNNPDNIIRIQWQDHWKFHKEIASERHKSDLEYVKKIAEGRQKYIENNRHVFAERARNLNKKLWENPEFRKRHSQRIRDLWKDPEYRKYMAKASSQNLRRLWKRKDFQELMSKIKSRELKRRWQGEEYRTIMAEYMKRVSLKIWSNPEHREHISKLMKEKTQDLAWRERQSRIAKALWQNPEYRAKYPKGHFEKMARSLWVKPGIREFHREKIFRQRQNPEFIKRNKKALQALYKQRMEENPNLMKELTEKAKISLCKNWQHPAYKEKVIKSKILGYVYSLSKKYSKITLQTYERGRTNNGVPKIENALNYFDSFSELINNAQKYNHKVVKTKILQEREDVYDLTCEPWHNFLLDAGVFVHNSIDGDGAAAMRYSECKLSRVGEEMLRDIQRDTVDFRENYDATRKEPTCLPSPLPQLLLNGTLGIAVGMATNIPPHNLAEVIEAAVHLLFHPKTTTEELFNFIKGPDFPTGGLVYNQSEIISAYSQGRGPIVTRGRAEIVEDKSEGRQIVISEIPFQVRKSALLEQFAKLVQQKKIEGVRDIRDESDKEGIRVVLDLAKNSFPQKILNRLYKFTDLQRTFHLNMLALVDGIQPKVLSLAEVLGYFLEHRRKVVVRRTKYDLDKAEQKAHILEGLDKCLSRIDAVIAIIKNSKTREEAQKNLVAKFRITQIQANAILETKLSALARLEREKIAKELMETRAAIKELSAVLKSPEKVKEVIKKEFEQLKEKFADQRRTKVYVQKVGEIAEEDLIPQEETIVTLTQGGYIKRISPQTYRSQKRGGKGILGMQTTGDDIVEHFFSCNTHDSLLFFTDSGKVFKDKAYELPVLPRAAKGRGLANFLEISPQDKVLSVLALRKEDKERGINYLAMATKSGIIKKTALEDFDNVRRSGLFAITLRKGDLLRQVAKTGVKDDIILVTEKGQAVRISESQLRPMRRQASGVRGIRLKKGDEVVGMEVIRNTETKEQKAGQKKSYLLVITENGYGKRTEVNHFKIQRRGGVGVKAAKVTKKTGEVIAVRVVQSEKEDLIVVSQKGQVIRTKIASIPFLGRATQGVKIMRLDDDRVASVTCI